MYCRKCGNPIIDIDKNFCRYCGAPIRHNEKNMNHLLAGIKKHDESAINEFYTKGISIAKNCAMSYVDRQTEVAEDIAQETMLKALKKIDTFEIRDGKTLDGWIYKIATNKSIDYVRSQKKRSGTKKDELENAEGKTNPVRVINFSALDDRENGIEFDPEDTKYASTPEEQLSLSERDRIVREIIENLSEEQRQVAVMYYFDNLTLKEIAQTLGIDQSTVTGRYQTANKNIKSEVEIIQKRDDIKLRSIAPIPFFMWLMKHMSETQKAAISSQYGKENIAQAFVSSSGKIASNSNSSLVSASKSFPKQSNLSSIDSTVQKSAAVHVAKKGFLSGFRTSAKIALATVVTTGTLTTAAVINDSNSVLSQSEVNAIQEVVNNDQEEIADENEIAANVEHFSKIGIVTKPTDVVLKFFDSIKNADYQKVTECLEPTTENAVNMIGSGYEGISNFWSGNNKTWQEQLSEAMGEQDVNIIECKAFNLIYDSNIDVLSDWVPKIPALRNLLCSEADVYIKYRSKEDGEYYIESEVIHVQKYGSSGWRIDPYTTFGLNSED